MFWEVCLCYEQGLGLAFLDRNGLDTLLVLAMHIMKQSTSLRQSTSDA